MIAFADYQWETLTTYLLKFPAYKVYINLYITEAVCLHVQCSQSLITYDTNY